MNQKKKRDSSSYFWHILYYTNWLHSKINNQQTHSLASSHSTPNWKNSTCEGEKQAPGSPPILQQHESLGGISIALQYPYRDYTLFFSNNCGDPTNQIIGLLATVTRRFDWMRCFLDARSAL